MSSGEFWRALIWIIIVFKKYRRFKEYLHMLWWFILGNDANKLEKRDFIKAYIIDVV